MKLTSLIMTGLMIFALGVTAFADAADAGKRSRRNAAIGIGLGAATLAIIAAGSSKARAERYDDDYEYRPRRRGPSCGELRWRCERGNEWACDRYDYRC